MNDTLKILNLEDSKNDHDLIVARLNEEGMKFEISRVETKEDFIAALENKKFDLILADYKLPLFSGTEALEITKEKVPNMPFIFVTGSMGEEKAIATLKQGATDYMLKDRLGGLAIAIRRALKEKAEKRNLMLAEEMLRESEERFRTIAETATDAIICLKEPDLVYFWNRKAEEIFGYMAEEIVTKSMHEVIVPGDAYERALNGLKAFFQSGTGPLVGKTVEVTGMRKDGTTIPVELSVSSMRVGGRYHAVGILRDITKRKEAEARLNGQLEELKRFQNATVHREFRMQEIKNENDKLRNRIKELEKEDA